MVMQFARSICWGGTSVALFGNPSLNSFYCKTLISPEPGSKPLILKHNFLQRIISFASSEYLGVLISKNFSI